MEKYLIKDIEKGRELMNIISKISTKKNNEKLTENSTVLRNQIIDDVDLDGEKVMMNLDKGQYFMMNDVGSIIWDMIESPIKIEQIVDKIIEEFEVERIICEKEVINFLNSLRDEELVNIV
ncbi:lasso peptide biosynthesis PqqD family chaperone [Oceanirhabdus sp. W0125-5]|uniref:lasso peptide biosynthesis PqqD family chaperone n=1 Tax=Oceanirhabdus sp. W0125-5 TaxID=2999116 RepID=UPI0022F31652|nr:lasso peptide biosynthesis PqqD family chaperone [Oceanirhabdus sp. W0125-5]WBW98963.1 lasso peptide biosynthesis PqqD family chaperone [Oceanirhabdus sp. W0125-5]